MPDPFELIAPLDPPKEIMAEGAVLLRGAALPFEKQLSQPVFVATQINAIGETISYAASECALGHVLASVND
jgi:hypothetical protein